MKNWLINLLIAAISVLTPIKPLLLSVMFLIIGDFIFGLWRAYKNGEEITSRKMGNTIGKVLLYNIMVISVFLINKFLINTGVPVEKIAAGLISIIELKSIDESFKVIYGWSVYDKLRRYLERASTTKEETK